MKTIRNGKNSDTSKTRRKGAKKQEAIICFLYPDQFLLFCRLTGSTPARLLMDFVENLSSSPWKREGREKARTHLSDYFIERGYCRQYYPEAGIREMFREMEAVSLVFPSEASDKMTELYTRWGERH
jgi:hypothetical protein